MATLYTPRYTWSSAATADGQTYSLITDLGNGMSVVWATATERTDKRFPKHATWEMKSVAAGPTLHPPPATLPRHHARAGPGDHRRPVRHLPRARQWSVGLMRYLVFAAFYCLIGLGITAVSPHHPTAELTRERQIAILVWPATVAARVWGDYLANHPRAEPKGDRLP